MLRLNRGFARGQATRKDGPLQVLSDEEHVFRVTVHVLTVFMVVSIQVWQLFAAIPPYMDEGYHVPQAEKIIQRGVYGGILAQGAWDPKITTFPGSYLFSAGLHLWFRNWHLLFKYASTSWRTLFPIQYSSDASENSSSRWGRDLALTTVATTDSFPWLTSWLLRDGAISNSPQSLRLGNVLLGALTFLMAILARKAMLFKKGTESGEKTESSHVTVLLALTVSLFPVLFFHHFLYYTDSTSTFCLIAVMWSATATANQSPHSSLMYRLVIQPAMLIGVLFCASAALLARQTNAVWLVFVAGITCAKFKATIKHTNFVLFYVYRCKLRKICLVAFRRCNIISRHSVDVADAL